MKIKRVFAILLCSVLFCLADCGGHPQSDTDNSLICTLEVRCDSLLTRLGDCSDYKLADGCKIVFACTCSLGSDIGAEYQE